MSGACDPLGKCSKAFPSFLRPPTLANRVEEKIDGFPDSRISETVLGAPTTEHVLGGRTGYFLHSRVKRRGDSHDATHEGPEWPRPYRRALAIEVPAALGRGPDVGEPRCRSSRIRRRGFEGATR